MREKYPKVGIIIPCFNEEDYLLEAIGSAVSQDYLNIHVYVTDDGSTDNSYFRIKRLSRMYINLHIFRLEENRGVAKAINTAADNAIKDGCEFITVFSADDLMPEEVISRSIIYMSDPDIDAVVIPFRTIGGQADSLHIPNEDVSLNSLLESNRLSGFVMYRTEVWQELEGYTNAYLPIAKSSIEDWDMLARFLKKGYKYAVAKDTCILHRQHPNQETNKISKDMPKLTKMLRERIEGM